MKLLADCDKLDRRILWLLDQDCRISHSDLARKVRRGSDTVRYRVNRLFKSQIVHSAIPVINLSALGFTAYKSYLRLKGSNKSRQAFLHRLDSHPRVYWLSEWYGRWDIVCTLAAHSPVEFSKLRDNLFYAGTTCVQSMDLTILTKVYRWPKDYLVGEGKKYSIQDSVVPPVAINKRDKKLLALLAQDARQGISSLARALDTTQSIVRGRLEYFEKSSVTAAYRIQLNYEKSGILLFKLFLRPASPTPELEEALRLFSEERPEVTCLVTQLGIYPYEMEVECEEYSLFHQFVDILRTRFSNYLREVEYAVLRKDHFHRIPF